MPKTIAQTLVKMRALQYAVEFLADAAEQAARTLPAYADPVIIQNAWDNALSRLIDDPNHDAIPAFKEEIRRQLTPSKGMP